MAALGVDRAQRHGAIGAVRPSGGGAASVWAPVVVRRLLGGLAWVAAHWRASARSARICRLGFDWRRRGWRELA